jgi:hypothetical protein
MKARRSRRLPSQDPREGERKQNLAWASESGEQEILVS